MESPKDVLKPPIGQRIRAARKNAGLTLEEVSQRIGISNQALSAIERGKKNPSRQTLMSLARVFHNNYGEVWLADHLADRRTEFHLETGPQGPKIDKAILMMLFGEFLDKTFGEGQVKLIPEQPERTVSVRVGFEIRETGFDRIDNGSEYIEVPPQMFSPGRGAMAGIVKGKSLRDAFVDRGDVVIIAAGPDSIDGKTILALAKGVVMLRRCEVKGDEVVLTPFDENSTPVKVPVKKLVCVGEVTGVIRLMEREI